MADYVFRVWDCLDDEDAIDASITSFAGRSESHIERARNRGIGWTSLARARLRPWDLIVMADHMPLEFPRSVRKLIVPHGPGPARLVRGGSYYYDRQRVFWPDGEPVYTCMLDTSQRAVERALGWVPEYAGRIQVTGDLRADELFGHQANRDQCRARLGVGRRQLVGIMSTWGPHGLIPQYGREFFEECRRLIDEGSHAFVLTMHRNLWDPARAGTQQWRDMARSMASEHFHVIGPSDDWAELLAATDMAISDHTSLSMIYSVLGYPLIPVSVPPEVLVEGTFARWLVENRPPVRSAKELRAALTSAEVVYHLDGAPKVIDELGRSRALTRAAVLHQLERFPDPR